MLRKTQDVVSSSVEIAAAVSVWCCRAIVAVKWMISRFILFFACVPCTSLWPVSSSGTARVTSHYFQTSWDTDEPVGGVHD